MINPGEQLRINESDTYIFTTTHDPDHEKELKDLRKRVQDLEFQVGRSAFNTELQNIRWEFEHRLTVINQQLERLERS